MQENFDQKAAKKFLLEKEEKEKRDREEERQAVLQRVIFLLQEEFKESAVEVYLVGSVIQPFCFSPYSDVDIVLKNYKGDRFDFWTKLEGKIGRKVEIILFETCHFQEFILKDGFKMV